MEFERSIFTAPDGAEIKYIDVGNGPVLLYVYGMGSSITSATALVTALKEHYRVIVFDQRGYGDTAPVGNMGIHQSAKDAKAIMEHLGIDKYAIFGYSMGAAVVFSYIEQFGCGCLERVILGDMSPKLINEGGWNLGLLQGHYTRAMYEADLDIIRNDYRRFSMYLTEQLMFKHTPDQEREPYTSAEETEARIMAKEHNPLIRQALFAGMVDLPEEKAAAVYHYWITMASADFRSILKDINVPTAIIYANPGSGYCPGTAEFMRSQIPDSTLCPMPDCSHMAASENAPLFIQYLLDFGASR